MKKSEKFNKIDCLEKISHFLPAQATLKDFITQNRLVSFQEKDFHDAMKISSEIFGYKVYLSLKEFIDLFNKQKINLAILESVVIKFKGEENKAEWLNKLFQPENNVSKGKKIGKLRSIWKNQYKIDLDSYTHTSLFKIICSYLDQGIAIWNFPIGHLGFLESIKELEKISFSSFFKTKRAKNLLLSDNCTIESLLKIIVGDEKLYEQYLFDQQFSHPGWSGLVSVLQNKPDSLLDTKKIDLNDIIILELLLELDTLDDHFGEIWSPLCINVGDSKIDLFGKTLQTENDELLKIWQEAYEWTFYDQVLSSIPNPSIKKENTETSFQAFFCIDDRECSVRRHIEKFDKNCKTFGTPGHFNVEFYFQPENGKFHTKVCPAPITPKFLIKEIESNSKRKKEIHFKKQANSLLLGWFYTHTIGFWSAFKLTLNIFRPRSSAIMVSASQHMGAKSKLSIENKSHSDKEGDLQIGFTIDQMTDRLEGLLKSTGLVKDFAPIVYTVGHGSSSVNNTHYAVYDCGACSGRPGSVNARVISYIGNHKEVRKNLALRGVIIPEETQFIGALHDTSRDEILFYDTENLNSRNSELHKINEKNFNLALDDNAKERSRRFLLIDIKKSAKKIHDLIKIRTVSLFEPRPELTHCGNALCIVGSRNISKSIFLDRRSFLNSFDYKVDPEGNYLLNILNAVAPVCGGINLEYYFSRVDNHHLGAGTKLPHNVMGLFGVANGIEGDLRTGLPNQMVEIHEPLRLMAIVEHFPEVVLKTIQKNPSTYEWFNNEWVRLMVIHPETREFYLFQKGEFTQYLPINKNIETTNDMMSLVETSHDPINIHKLNNN